MERRSGRMEEAAAQIGRVTTGPSHRHSNTHTTRVAAGARVCLKQWKQRQGGGVRLDLTLLA